MDRSWGKRGGSSGLSLINWFSLEVSLEVSLGGWGDDNEERGLDVRRQALEGILDA